MHQPLELVTMGHDQFRHDPLTKKFVGRVNSGEQLFLYSFPVDCLTRINQVSFDSGIIAQTRIPPYFKNGQS